MKNNVNHIHYSPNNGFFGDPIPYYWNGVYHVFYDKLKEDNKICWAHITSKNLINWEELPDAIPNGNSGSLDETHCITGSIIEKGGTFYAFYTGVGKYGPNICRATSSDLINWGKASEPVLKRGSDLYRQDDTWRDPCVFWNPEEKCYWMVFCARHPMKNDNSLSGVMGLAISHDLDSWCVQEPVWVPNLSTVAECPDIFQYKDKWVLAYFWHETRYRLALSPKGPWVRPRVQAPDSFDFFAGKTMSDGKRRIVIGWIPRKNCDCAERIWGGKMAIPREFYLLSDGTPAIKCVPEVANFFTEDATKGKGAHVFEGLTGDWNTKFGDISGYAYNGGSLAFWKDAPDDYYIEADIFFESNNSSAAFYIRTNPSPKAMGEFCCNTDEGYQLILDPVENMIRLRELYQWDQRNDIASIPYSFDMETATNCKMFVHGDILELFVGEKQSLVSRLLKYPLGGLGLYAQDGRVDFRNLSVKHIK